VEPSPRSIRRVTSISAASLSAGGAVRSVLSRLSVASARPWEGRRAVPPKITSSMPPPRTWRGAVSPMTQRIASTRFDLPQPLGPTIPVSPGSM